MIDEEFRFISIRGYQTGLIEAIICDYDQRRHFAVRNFESRRVTLDERQIWDEEVAEALLKKHVDSLGPDVYGIAPSPDGKSIIKYTDPRLDNTLVPHYLCLKDLDVPSHVGTVVRSDLTEVNRLYMSADHVVFTTETGQIKESVFNRARPSDEVRGHTDVNLFTIAIYEFITRDFRPWDAIENLLARDCLAKFHEIMKWEKHPSVKLDHDVSEFSRHLKDWANRRVPDLASPPDTCPPQVSEKRSRDSDSADLPATKRLKDDNTVAAAVHSTDGDGGAGALGSIEVGPDGCVLPTRDEVWQYVDCPPLSTRQLIMTRQARSCRAALVEYGKTFIRWERPASKDLTPGVKLLANGKFAKEDDEVSSPLSPSDSHSSWSIEWEDSFIPLERWGDEAVYGFIPSNHVVPPEPGSEPAPDSVASPTAVTYSPLRLTVEVADAAVPPSASSKTKSTTVEEVAVSISSSSHSLSEQTTGESAKPEPSSPRPASRSPPLVTEDDSVSAPSPQTATEQTTREFAKPEPSSPRPASRSPPLDTEDDSVLPPSPQTATEAVAPEATADSTPSSRSAVPGTADNV